MARRRLQAALFISIFCIPMLPMLAAIGSRGRAQPHARMVVDQAGLEHEFWSPGAPRHWREYLLQR